MNFFLPNSLNEALAFADKHPDYKILAGGTDLCVGLNGGQLQPEGLISIWGIDELRNISQDAAHVYIGALATHTNIAESAFIKKYVPALAEACKGIGARQIQNRGTIGGNVMNASPAGDTLPVLLAYDAEVEAACAKGRRWIKFSQFYTGYRKTALVAGEIIVQFKIPKAHTGERAAFLKVGTRKAQAISKVMGCFRYNSANPPLTKGGEGGFVIAFGSIAPTPVRLTKAEKFLIGKKLEPKIIEEACKIAAKEVSPIDDIRSTATYRRYICGVLLKRFLNNL